MMQTLSILGDGEVLSRQVIHLASLLGDPFVAVFGYEISHDHARTSF